MKNTIDFRWIGNGILWGLFICLIFPSAMPDLFGADSGFIAAGPDGGLVRALAIDPADPRTVYAGTLNGVFKSTDGGNHWSTANTGIEGLGISSLAIDPENTRTVYAGTFDSLFKSTDGGKSWIKLNSDPGLVEGNPSVVLDPLSPQTLYLGSMPYGIVKSTDGGVHWVPANSGITNKNVNKLIINPSSPAILYTGTHKGLFKTIDGGTSWTEVQAGLTDLSITALAIDSAQPQTVYAGTYRSGVFVSRDGGVQWNAVNAGLLPGTVVRALAVDPKDHAVYVSLYENVRYEDRKNYTPRINSHIFRSTDRGGSWTAVNSGLSPAEAVYTLMVSPESAETVYAGTDGGIYKSTDGGGSWNASGHGIRNALATALALDPAAPETVYAGMDTGGVNKSTDGGRSWIATGKELHDTKVVALAVHPQDPQVVFAGTDHELFRSTDGGKSWEVFKPDFNLAAGRILAIDARATLTVYTMEIIKKNDLFDRAGISRFKFGRSGWWKSDMGSLPSAIHTLALDPESQQKVYATTSIGIYAHYGGNEWTAIGDEDSGRGVGTWIGFIAMALDPASPGTFWFANRAGLSRCAFVPRETLPGINIVPRMFGKIPISNDIWKVKKTWPVFVDVGGIAVAPTSPPTVYAATSCCGVLKNTVGTGD